MIGPAVGARQPHDEPRVGVPATMLWAMCYAVDNTAEKILVVGLPPPLSRLLLHCRLRMRAASAQHPVGHLGDRHDDWPTILAAGQAIRCNMMLIF